VASLGSVTGVRIVSLLPSTTEICFAVGAGDDVVGVTFECDFPAEAKSRRIVSTSALTPGLTPVQIDAEVKARIAAGEDLYHLDEGALATLDADLVLTQDLCAVCAVDVSTVGDALDHLGCRAQVLTVDPGRLHEVIDSVVTIGAATGHRQAAAELASELRTRLAAVETAVAGRPRPRVAVLEWTDPAFTAGHWVPDMVTAAGGDPVLGTAGERSVETTWEQVAASAPDLVVVSPCGYRLPAAIELAEAVVAAGVLPPGAAVWAVDADAAYVRPGPRLVDGVEALASLCHPMALPARPELATRVTPAAG
jgi:iron complex transport system substrate-binding protein